VASQRWSIHFRRQWRLGVHHVIEGRARGTVIRVLFLRIIRWHEPPAPPADRAGS
jgi:hypothetical protein